MFGTVGGNTAIKIATISKKGSWGSLVRQACFRRGYQNITQYFDSLDKLDSLHEYDIIFIDEHAQGSTSGSELLEYLKVNNKVPYTSAIILIGESKKEFESSYDLELQVAEYLSSPFSEKDVLDIIEQANNVINTLRPALAFINNGKISFALKALKAIPKEKLTLQTVQYYYRLLVNLTYKLGQYEKVLSMCDSKLISKQYWSLWPKFKANYELGNREYCTSAMTKEPFSSVVNSPTKLFWQVRISLEEQNYADAIELIDNFPAHQMSLDTIRLVFTILTFSGQWNQAEEFIERKIRLAGTDNKLLGVLTMALCNVYLYQYYTAPNNEMRNRVFEVLKRRLTEFRSRPLSNVFKNDILYIDTMLLIATDAWQKNEKVLFGITRQLDQIQADDKRALMRCRLSYAWFLLGENERSFNNLQMADVAFDSLPFGCERLILGMVHKQIFNAMFAEETRHLAYKKLADTHLRNQRYKLSCKAYSRSLEIKRDDVTRKRLARAMTNAGIDQFAGFRINKELELDNN